MKPLITEQLSDPLPPYCLQNMGPKARVDRPTPPDIPFYGFTTARSLKLTYLWFVYILDTEILPSLPLPTMLFSMSVTADAELKTATSASFQAVEVVGRGGVATVSTSLDLCAPAAASQVSSQ